MSSFYLPLWNEWPILGCPSECWTAPKTVPFPWVYPIWNQDSHKYIGRDCQNLFFPKFPSPPPFVSTIANRLIYTANRTLPASALFILSHISWWCCSEGFFVHSGILPFSPQLNKQFQNDQNVGYCSKGNVQNRFGSDFPGWWPPFSPVSGYKPLWFWDYIDNRCTRSIHYSRSKP